MSRWFDKGIGMYRTREEQEAWWSREFEAKPNIPDGVRAKRLGCDHTAVFKQRVKRGIACTPKRGWVNG